MSHKLEKKEFSRRREQVCRGLWMFGGNLDGVTCGHSTTRTSLDRQHPVGIITDHCDQRAAKDCGTCRPPFTIAHTSTGAGAAA